MRGFSFGWICPCLDSLPVDGEVEYPVAVVPAEVRLHERLGDELRLGLRRPQGDEYLGPELPEPLGLGDDHRKGS